MSYRATQADRPVQPHLMNMARLSPPRAPCDKSPVAPNHFIGRLHISQRIENRRDVMRFNKMLVVGTSAVGLCLPASGVLAQTQQPAPTPPSAGSPGSVQASSSYTDGELQHFASAAIATQPLENDSAAALAHKEPMMAAAVQQSGLHTPRVTEIAQASKPYKAQMQRTQNTVGKRTGSG